jgi:hypothetical protein
MFHLTFDQDWAPAWATLELAQRLGDAGLTGTLFATHDCPSLARAGEILELGWHPNFLHGSSHGQGIDDVLDTMERLVPGAVGVRAHCLVRGTPFLVAYEKRGLRYDASDLHDGVPGLQPFQSWTGVTRVPIWLEDDVLLERGMPCTLDALDLTSPGLKVVNMHPVLIALNCAALDRYSELKRSLSERGVRLQDATREDFAPHVQQDRPGIADLLKALIAFLEKHPERAGGALRTLMA